MHTLSMHARQSARWRWLTVAVVVIVAQLALAVIVRSDDTGERQSSDTNHGRGITPRP
jgi:hypothetical protein